jgi:hypothetical protein
MLSDGRYRGVRSDAADVGAPSESGSARQSTDHRSWDREPDGTTAGSRCGRSRRSAMMRKQVISVLGVGSLALAALVAQPLAPHVVTAQSTAATPAASPSAMLPNEAAPTTKTSPANVWYQDFVSRLAANLGESDKTKVDQAIRTTLKQEVDAKVASGDIAGKVADAIKAKIDSPDFPADLIGLMAMMHGGMMHPGMMPGMMHPGMSGHGPGSWEHRPGAHGDNGGWENERGRWGEDHGGDWNNKPGMQNGGMNDNSGSGNGGYQKSNGGATATGTPTT